MRGIKTQEGEKFIEFFILVQAEANRRHSVFFLECGEGHDLISDTIEGEDLRGWLIPEEQADKFEAEWLSGEPSQEWENLISWAIWSGNAMNLQIEIKQF